MIHRFMAIFIAGFLLSGRSARSEDLTPPQQANPTPGCRLSTAEVEANRKVAMDFFRVVGQGRVALLDPRYKQHNPVMMQRAQEENLSDYEEAKRAFREQANGSVHGLGLGPTPPGNRFEIVTAECDIVTIVHSGFRHDPTGQSKFYEGFTFDTFRVKNGKLVEHWDGASLSAPSQPGPASPPPQH